MGRAKGSGNVFDSVIRAAVPTENKGIMSGPMRKPRGGRIDKRGSRRGGIFGGSSMVQASFKDPVSGRMFGGLIKDGVPQFKKPDFISDEDYKKNFPKLSGPLGKPTVSPPPPPRSIGQRPFGMNDEQIRKQNPYLFDRETGRFVCPDPNMSILMADGTEKKAGDLVIGDLVKTYHETSFELGDYKVEHVDVVSDVEKIKLIFDKSTIVCSLSHKLYVNNSWKKAEDMVIGDKVSDKELIAIENVEDGDVVRITIKDAHTYICEGLLSHNKSPRRGPIGRRMPPRDRPLTGGYNPESGVRYTDTGVPTAVQQTRRVAVQDPTLGGAPEREVPIARERRQRITRESDPRGAAPFSPDERGMARDRFFERMFERADEAKQQRSMEREERDNVRDALKSERGIRESEMAGPGDERQGGGGGMRRRRRKRRRDFTRRRSQMEGGKRGRSSREMAEFRDRYVSTLGGGFFS